MFASPAPHRANAIAAPVVIFRLGRPRPRREIAMTTPGTPAAKGFPLPAIAARATRIDVYDTTLRDGSQQEGITLSVADKLEIARRLDEIGVGYIEGGWPGAIPRDTEFFRRAAAELKLKNAALTAFGSTRKAGVAVEDDPQIAALIDSGAPVVCIVAKSHIRHVELALRTTPEENLAMITESVRYLRAQGRRVFVDAEHFFDGFLLDRDYALAAVRAAHEAGAEVVVLCDTNGGMLPTWVGKIVAETRAACTGKLGIHTHNDTGCAVANAVAAVEAGAAHVQGTINGYGERTGNADLLAVVANLELKYGLELLPKGKLAEITYAAHGIAELTNIPPMKRQPYVGFSAFAHKAGLHASAIRQDADLYQHIDPLAVGNDMRMLVSDMAGRASIELKAREFGLDISDRPEVLAAVTERVKELEARGYTFDAAEASFELLLREQLDGAPLKYFDVTNWTVHTENNGDHVATSTATVTLRQKDGSEVVLGGKGNGPVNALDHAIRFGLRQQYPEIDAFELTDFTVRILESSHGTGAITRVLITTSGKDKDWRTVGVGENILDAAWEALTASYAYGLRLIGVEPR
ncbi:MAG: citramalate synthase [Azoarcus sp.]|jgi:2-isopropylmalate synthase|nr:citramalate synthase [Azoarcus sp.]